MDGSFIKGVGFENWLDLCRIARDNSEPHHWSARSRVGGDHLFKKLCNFGHSYQPINPIPVCSTNKQLNVQPTKINSPLENSRLWPISARTNQALRIGWIDYKTNLPTNS